MAITITEVTQNRVADLSTVPIQARESYYVQFSTDTVAEYADYVTKLNMCLTAVDPSTGLEIPQFAAQFRSDISGDEFLTFVRNVNPKMFKRQNNRFEVFVEYRETDDQEDPDTLSDDPENLVTTYSWDTTNVKQIIWQDFTPQADNGPLAIVNSAVQGFTTLPTIDRDLMTCTISRKTVGTYDPDTAADIVNTINDAPLTINGKGPFPAKTVKCRRWAGIETEAVVQKTGGVPPTAVDYDQETIVLVIDKKEWIGRIFDQGLSFFAESGSSIPGFGAGQHAIRRKGERVTSPQPLSGRGLTVFDQNTGESLNNVVAEPNIGNGVDPGLPGVEAIQVGGNDVGAMLLFNFYEQTDFSVLGSI